MPERKVERTDGESAFQREGLRIKTEPKLSCYVELRYQVYLRVEMDG